MSSCGSSHLAFVTSWSPPFSMTFMCPVTELCCQEKHGKSWVGLGDQCVLQVSVYPQGKRNSVGLSFT